MNNDHNSRFSEGFFLGIMVGALMVFLFGTKTGKNFVKIFSEQGWDGIANLMEEYDLSKIEEEDMVDEDANEDLEGSGNSQPEKIRTSYSEEVKPRKRFFRRFKKSN